MQQSLRPTNLSKYRLEEEEPAPRSSTHAGAGEQATRCLPKQAAVYKLFAANTSPRNGITDGSFWASLPIASKLLVLLVFAQTATWVINLAASSAQVGPAQQHTLQLGVPREGWGPCEGHSIGAMCAPAGLLLCGGGLLALLCCGILPVAPDWCGSRPA
jgi:hypothetical protein